MARNVPRKTTGFRSDLIPDFLEAVYCLDADDQAWLASVMNAARNLSGRGRTMHAAIYDASDVSNLRVSTFHALDIPDGGIEWLMESTRTATPEFVARTFRREIIQAATLSKGQAWRDILAGLKSFGFSDSLNIKGLDPGGLGAFLVIWRPDRREIPAAEWECYRRLAHHLGAAYRFRRRLGGDRTGSSIDLTDGAEAILDARGRIIHAAVTAQPKAAQASLIETFNARDRARASGARAGEGLRRWRPLTSARWTLVDQFERSGARYIVARENQTEVNGLQQLSDRERQVVAYLAVGQSTKETAYALGISDATVRVLISRAVSKLGAGTRAALLARPDVQRLRPAAS